MRIIPYNETNPALPNQSLFGNYENRTFSQIFESAEDFTKEYMASGIYEDADNRIEKINVLFYLLYSYYGNSVIASYDENRFKYNLFSIIYQYGPSWEAKLKAQKKIRDLLDSEELFTGTVSINNHSLNPSTPPSMDAFEPLATVNNQSAQKWKKSKLEGYAGLMAVLRNDVSAEFLERFRKLFLVIVQPNMPLWYNTTPEEQEILDI